MVGSAGPICPDSRHPGDRSSRGPRDVIVRRCDHEPGPAGNDEGVADSDRVRAAADQLYAADPAEFTDQRADLVAQARAAGDKTAARAIGAFRRPTRAAWVVNRLAPTDPAAVDRLTALGDQLRAAESALDGR